MEGFVMLDYLKTSTLKREAATALMVWLLGMSTYIIFTNPSEVQLQVLGMFSLPIPLIFAGAYGMDWISKQTSIAGPPITAATTTTTISTPAAETTMVQTTTEPGASAAG